MIRRRKPLKSASGPHSRVSRKKMAVRFLDPLDAPLRSHALYRGDLTRLVMDAVDRTRFDRVPIADMTQPYCKETCLMVPWDWYEHFKALSDAHALSFNELVNTAVAVMLDRAGEVTLDVVDAPAAGSPKRRAGRRPA